MIAKFKYLAIPLSVLLTACSITPHPVSLDEQKEITSQDRIKASSGVEPVGLTLTLNEAVARGLKYNLEYRSKMMERAIAMGAADLSNYDMLPKIAANAGYNYRNNYFITKAEGAYTGTPVTSEPLITSAKDYGVIGLGLSWNLLDFGVSYYSAVQNADKVLVASEQRRHAMHLLIQDIQTAYIRAASAQQLKNELNTTIIAATEALKNSKKSDEEGLRTPLEALKYQKSLLDNVRILETIRQELSSAVIELNHLINLPPATAYELESLNTIIIPNAYLDKDPSEFEIRALANNADLKESIYTARIAVVETRKSLLRLLPSLNLSVGPQASNNSFYLNQNWVEGAAQVSYNLWNILTAPMVKKQAEANEALAAQKRMMVQMAVVSQVYIAKYTLGNALTLFERSGEISDVDDRISEITETKEKEGSASSAEKVAADANAILSKLRKYQALSQLFAASGRLQATAGLEPDISSLDDITLNELTGVVKKAFSAWNSGELPPLQIAEIEQTANKTANSDQKSDQAESQTAIAQAIN